MGGFNKCMTNIYFLNIPIKNQTFQKKMFFDKSKLWLVCL